MAWFECGGGSGGDKGVEKILSNGIISDTSDYRTAHFSDISNWDKIHISFTFNGEKQISSIDYDINDIENGVSLKTCLMPIDKYLTIYLTKTSIASTYYTSDFVNILVDIYVIKNE